MTNSNEREEWDAFKAAGGYVIASAQAPFGDPADEIMVRKKDGRMEKYNDEKIATAAAKALRAVGHSDEFVADKSAVVAERVTAYFRGRGIIDFNEIHDRVELTLMDVSKEAAQAYIRYRWERKQVQIGRDVLVEGMKSIVKEADNSNANMINSPSTKMHQIASLNMQYYVLNHLLPPDLADAHKSGDFHIHDMDYYPMCPNCINYDLGALLEGGFYMPHGFVRAPKRPISVTALAAVSLQSVQNDQFGGVGVDRIDTALAKFMKEASYSDIYQAIEALIFNLNSLHSRAGNQIPFSSVSIGVDTDPTAQMVCRAILEVYDKGLGKGEMPMFPNIIFKIKEGVNWEPDSPNHYLLRKALDVTSRRMNPTYVFLDASFNQKYGLEVMAMGCRTRVIANRRGPELTAGRGNIAFNTINLPRIGIKANHSEALAIKLLREKLEMAERQLIHRWDILRKLRVKDVPFNFHGIYMGSEKLGPNDFIEDSLANGTLTIGFHGLAEYLAAITGYYHSESDHAQQLGIMTIETMREFTDRLCDKHNLNWSLLGTPAEGLAGRFTLLDRARYGTISKVTDKEHYTNSFHVPVAQDVTIEYKIDIEAPYHALCNGGHISYEELGYPPRHNVDGLYSILGYMKAKNMGYVGFNFPVDQCVMCGFQDVFDGNCPACNSDWIKAVRRVTGYFSVKDRINLGKLDEIARRTSHAGKEIRL